MPSTVANDKGGQAGEILVTLADVPETVFKILQSELEAEGPCSFSFEKFWSESDQRYVVHTTIHGPVHECKLSRDKS